MIMSTHIANTKISVLIAVLVFRLLSHNIFFMDRKGNRNC